MFRTQTEQNAYNEGLEYFSFYMENRLECGLRSFDFDHNPYPVNSDEAYAWYLGTFVARNTQATASRQMVGF